jgi:hypothetical protein
LKVNSWDKCYLVDCYTTEITLQWKSTFGLAMAYKKINQELIFTTSFQSYNSLLNNIVQWHKTLPIEYKC